MRLAPLAERYAGQMHAYREVMQRAYPAAEVECILISTRCREWIALNEFPGYLHLDLPTEQGNEEGGK